MILSRGARLCESIIRTARSRGGGRRECGRPYLARRLGCSVRQVSRYVSELRAADRLEVIPPRRHRTSRGWRTIGTNTYTMTGGGHPAPPVLNTHTRRSRWGDTGVTPPPTGSVPAGVGPPADPTPPPTADQSGHVATARALLAQARQDRNRP